MTLINRLVRSIVTNLFKNPDFGKGNVLGFNKANFRNIHRGNLYL